ncbi:hypothetical protein PCE1_003798 [Barthelona sp. PCE]
MSGSSVIQLNALNELRVHLQQGTLEITLISGSAESEGSPVVLDRIYKFYGSSLTTFSGIDTVNPFPSFSIYTFSECKLKLEWNDCGGQEPFYVVTEPQSYLLQVLDLFKRLSDQRKAGYVTKVLFCGDSRVGKSSYMRMMCNFAAQTGVPAIVMDLDAEKPSFGAPMTFSLGLVSPDMPFGEEKEMQYPLQYFTGDTSPSPQLLHMLATNMLVSTQKRMSFLAKDSEFTPFALFVDTPSCYSLEQLDTIARTVRITHVICVDSPSMIHGLERMWQGRWAAQPTIWSLNSISSIPSFSPTKILAIRNCISHRYYSFYFNATTENPTHTNRVILPLSEILIGSKQIDTVLDDAMLPANYSKKQQINPCLVHNMEISESISHKLNNSIVMVYELPEKLSASDFRESGERDHVRNSRY